MSPAPTLSPPPKSIRGRLMGVGPFVIVQIRGSSGPYVAIDLGAPTFSRILLGTPGQLRAYDWASNMQAWGRSVPVDTQTSEGEDPATAVITTRFWFLSKGTGFDDEPLSVQGHFLASLTSPDGKQVIVLQLVQGDMGRDLQHADIEIMPTDGSPIRMLARVPKGGSTTEDVEFQLTPLVWLPGGGWLAVPICGCEGRPDTWYQISPSGKVTRASWLGVPTDIRPGVSTSGRLLSLYDVPVRACGVNKVCPNGPIRVIVADTVTHRIRVLAEYRNDLSSGSTVISPDGTLIASSAPGNSSVQVFDAKSGRIVAAVRYRDLSLTPAAFVDDSTLLLIEDTKTSGALVLARMEFGRVRVTQLIRGVDHFVGWSR